MVDRSGTGLLTRLSSSAKKVYCKDCYENRSLRKTTAKTPVTHFRRDPDNARKNLCAVDGCTSEANNKSNWVGLFL